jgi:hypothetical protein
MFLQCGRDKRVCGPQTAGKCGEEDALRLVVELVCGDELSCVFDGSGEAVGCNGAGCRGRARLEEGSGLVDLTD